MASESGIFLHHGDPLNFMSILLFLCRYILFVELTHLYDTTFSHASLPIAPLVLSFIFKSYVYVYTHDFVYLYKI